MIWQSEAPKNGPNPKTKTKTKREEKREEIHGRHEMQEIQEEDEKGEKEGDHLRGGVGAATLDRAPAN